MYLVDNFKNIFPMSKDFVVIFPVFEKLKTSFLLHIFKLKKIISSDLLQSKESGLFLKFA